MAAMGVVAIDFYGHLLAELLPSGAAMVALGAALIMMHHDALADPRFRGPDRGADRDYHAARFMPGDDSAFGHRDAGRANARPMTGSAKQSMARHNRKMDCFAALAMTGKYSFAVPRRSAPELCKNLRPVRAWGMPGADAPAAARVV